MSTEQVAKPLPAAVRRFIAEYLVDQNATAAYIRAGYKARGHAAESAASRLLRNVEVRRQIDDALARIRATAEQKAGLTLATVLDVIRKGVLFDPRKLYHDDGTAKPITKLDDDTVASIAGVEIEEIYAGQGKDKVFVGYLKKYKLTDRKGYVDMAMRHLGGYEKDNNQQGGLGALLGQLNRSAVPVAQQPAADDDEPA